MRTKDITQIVIDCLKNFLNDTVNEDLSEVQCNVYVDHSTRLIGQNAAVESIGLVSVIADVEEAIEDSLGVMITIVDERAMARDKSPFIDVASLSEYVYELLNEDA